MTGYWLTVEKSLLYVYKNFRYGWVRKRALITNLFPCMLSQLENFRKSKFGRKISEIVLIMTMTLKGFDLPYVCTNIGEKKNYDMSTFLFYNVHLNVQLLEELIIL
jgi:hypothetical protein